METEAWGFFELAVTALGIVVVGVGSWVVNRIFGILDNCTSRLRTVESDIASLNAFRQAQNSRLAKVEEGLRRVEDKLDRLMERILTKE